MPQPRSPLATDRVTWDVTLLAANAALALAVAATVALLPFIWQRGVRPGTEGTAATPQESRV